MGCTVEPRSSHDTEAKKIQTSGITIALDPPALGMLSEASFLNREYVEDGLVTLECAHRATVAVEAQGRPAC
jgi:hypothetical protein